MGQGRYKLEFAVTDKRGHTFRKQRKLQAGKDKAARKVPVSLERGAIEPLINARWSGALAKTGPRVTVLLHAYSGGARLNDSDRAFLLQSLEALLSDLPCQSVKLIAFNLDKQEVVFREENFDADGFVRLEHMLAGMKLGTIPYQALARTAWAKFLVEMTQGEATGEQSPDAIIFLGAWGSHEWDKVPKSMITNFQRSNARVFYLKYLPFAGAPQDGVERLTNDLHGSVFTIRSPETLAAAIKKMSAAMSAPSN